MSDPYEPRGPQSLWRGKTVPGIESDPSNPHVPTAPEALEDFLSAVKTITSDYGDLERLRTRGYLPENPARPPLKRPMDSLSSLNFDPSEGSE